MIELPISTITNDANEGGEPLCLARPADAERELHAFEKLAKDVSRELYRMLYGQTDSKEVVSFADSSDEFDLATINLNVDSSSGGFTVRLFSKNGAIQRRIGAADLRARDPKTGEVIDDSPFRDEMDQQVPSSDTLVTVHKNAGRKVSPSLNPSKADKKGRYGYAVQWGDGATIIYSKASIAKAAGGIL